LLLSNDFYFMHLFYTPDITTDPYSLSEEESRHCQKVLRLRDGDTVYLTDGRGTLFHARIADARGRQVMVEVISRQENYGRRPYRLHLAVAPTKNTDRYEWFLEKATEIGVDEITPLICEHSERRTLRTDRLVKIITAAVKQSVQAWHPKLNEPVEFRKFIAHDLPGQHFIAHLDEQQPLELQRLYTKGSDTVILIGPEGDFSEQEMESALKAGFLCVSLGRTRLRTETAAVVACHTVCLLNG
jgi:16S rRNA (uracil1498-N3)-methyltransferase